MGMMLHLSALAALGDCQGEGATPLAKGVHLRWAVSPELGLPWGGFYVFRRQAFVDDGKPADAWLPVPGLAQTLALPVCHPDYPAGLTIPMLPGLTPEKSCLEYGKARVSAPGKEDLPGGFSNLYTTLQELVKGGPTSTPMADRMLEAQPAESAKPDSPQLAEQPLLSLVLLGAVYPHYAQFLGLYAIDSSAQSGQCYDYMVVADFDNAFGPSIGMAIMWANSDKTNQPSVLFRIASGVQASFSAALPPPHSVQVYKLPLTSLPVPSKPDQLIQAFAAAGLVWNAAHLQDVVGDPAPAPHLFRVQRGSFAAVPLADLLCAPKDFKPKWSSVNWKPLYSGNSWHLAPSTKQPVGQGTGQPADWPPLAMQYVDGQLPEGWFAWSVRAMDWFGRVSQGSTPAVWSAWSWLPKAKIPSGWFSQLPGIELGFAETQLHPSAMRVLDKSPPPAPSGLEVDAIDPLDPMVQQSQWFADNQMKVAAAGFSARVRWVWPWTAQREAPDLAEFRVYGRAGIGNTFHGFVKGLAGSQASDSSLLVATTLALPANTSAAALVGSALRLNQTAATITACESGTAGLLFQVTLPSNHGKGAVVAGDNCTLVLAPQSPAWRPPSDVTQSDWKRLAVVMAKTCELQFEVFRDGDGESFMGGIEQTLLDGYKLAGTQPLDAVYPGLWRLVVVHANANHELDIAGAQSFALTSVDPVTRIVRTDAEPKKKSGQARWYLGQAVQSYELLLPLGDLVPEPAAGTGMAWFEVAVTAADNKPHSLDWLKSGPLSNHGGNEGLAAGPLRGSRVRRSLPATAELVAGPKEVLASKPDVDGRSFHTVRWKAGPVAVRVLRASALAVFRADWDGAASAEFKGKYAGFGAAEAGWYEKLGVDEVIKLANSPAGVKAFVPVMAAPVPEAVCPDRIGPDSEAGYKADAGLRAYVDTLDGLVAGRWLYRVETWDAAGNAGVATPAGCLVKVVVEERPVAPVILRVYPGSPETRKALLKAIEADGVGELPSEGLKCVTVEWSGGEKLPLEIRLLVHGKQGESETVAIGTFGGVWTSPELPSCIVDVSLTVLGDGDSRSASQTITGVGIL